MIFFIFFIIIHCDEIPSFSTKLPSPLPLNSYIGGGPNYPSIVPLNKATYIVSTKPEFESALSIATEGDVVYIDDNSVIVLNTTYFIDSGITIASGRGKVLDNGNISRGGVLFYDYFPETYQTNYLFQVRYGKYDVRITGLTIKGPDQEAHIGETNTDFPNQCAIYCLRCYNLMVDNNEIFGFNYAALYALYGGDATLKYNFIHHIHKHSYGYGVYILNAYVHVEGNLFDYTQTLYSSGEPGGGFLMTKNVVLGRGDTSFVRVNVDRSVYDNSFMSGEDMIFYNNLFCQHESEDEPEFPVYSGQYPLYIQGSSIVYTLSFDNHFKLYEGRTDTFYYMYQPANRRHGHIFDSNQYFNGTILSICDEFHHYTTTLIAPGYCDNPSDSYPLECNPINGTRRSS